MKHASSLCRLLLLGFMVSCGTARTGSSTIGVSDATIQNPKVRVGSKVNLVARGESVEIEVVDSPDNEICFQVRSILLNKGRSGPDYCRPINRKYRSPDMFAGSSGTSNSPSWMVMYLVDAKEQDLTVADKDGPVALAIDGDLALAVGGLHPILSVSTKDYRCDFPNGGLLLMCTKRN